MTVKQSIIDHEGRLLKAFQEKDLAVLDELLHEHCKMVLPNGLTVTKAAVLDSYRTGHKAMTGIIPSDYTVDLLGSTAVVTVKIQLTGVYADQVIDARYQYLRVWQLAGGLWQVIAGSGIVVI